MKKQIKKVSTLKLDNNCNILLPNDTLNNNCYYILQFEYNNNKVSFIKFFDSTGNFICKITKNEIEEISLKNLSKQDVCSLKHILDTEERNSDNYKNSLLNLFFYKTFIEKSH